MALLVSFERGRIYSQEVEWRQRIAENSHELPHPWSCLSPGPLHASVPRDAGCLLNRDVAGLRESSAITGLLPGGRK